MACILTLQLVIESILEFVFGKDNFELSPITMSSYVYC